MLLIAFTDGERQDQVSDDFVWRYGFNINSVRIAITRLSELGLLVTPEDPSHQRARSILSDWSDSGWVDAADYHLATLNYPFADYSLDGRTVDFDRMVAYVEQAPDLERTKSYPDAEIRIAAPKTPEALATLQTPFASVWLDQPDLAACTRDSCLTLLSSVFGKLRTRQLADDRSLMADAIGKTSPSGGSRHPTEAYLFALRVEGLDNGVYHYNVGDGTLDRIKDFCPTDSDLQALFSGPLRASFPVNAIIVLTSVFERSMYRYREPRSFRAIYMDVGHLCGTLDVVAKALHLNCLVQHGVNDKAVGNLLGLHALSEGVIYGAAIGGTHGYSDPADRADEHGVLHA